MQLSTTPLLLISLKHVVMLYGLELPLRELPVQRLAYRHLTYQERFQIVLAFLVEPSDVGKFSSCSVAV